MKIVLSSFFFLALWACTFQVEAQSSGQGDPNAIFQSPSSRDPEAEKSEVKGAKRSKKSFYRKNYNQQLDKKVEEYEERMEANAKKYRKRAKKMEKPQYSDPSYFGHKRKPKKRPPGKQKFCKECGIKH